MILPTLTFRVGARHSPLSLTQSRAALAELQRLLPECAFELVPMSSPGDEDRQTDLRAAAADFFTRYLDDGVLAGELDFAVHSAKDLPEPLREGLDWAWLPWREDPRDVLVLRPGQTVADLPPAPVAGISSERRDAYCRHRFPGAVLKPIRGNIEHRLAQLDRGDYDVLLMAGAALLRLGLHERISEWVPVAELPPPAGQGYLAITFRAGNPRLHALRQLFVKPVTLLSAGPGDPGLCPLAGVEALRRADLCLYDALAPAALLHHLPPGAEAVFVGKRGSHYSVARGELERRLVDACREGRRVVRLKGGDAGIFARLAQELEALDALALPYRVIPGVSSLQAATTGTGLLLTRKGLARGFCVTTPEQLGEAHSGVGAADRSALPLVLFMAVQRLPEVVAELLAEGRPADQPATMVFGASTADETLLCGTLGTIAELVAAHPTELPGLLLIGATAAAAYRYDRTGFALGGRRVLLTGSEDLLPQAIGAVHDYGGQPVPLPLIRLVPEPAAAAALRELARYDWLVLTSPAAVRCLMALLAEARQDLRRLPRLLVCGAGTADALRRHGLTPDAVPTSHYSAEAMLELARQVIAPGARVLRLRSDRAEPTVAETLTAAGARVDDVVLYRNEPVPHDRLPPSEVVFFASASAVDAWVARWGTAPLAERFTLVIGEPTERALARHGLRPGLVSPIATVPASIAALAAYFVCQRLQSLPPPR
jgi:uroporphyrinogen III methyltransferase/synthase